MKGIWGVWVRFYDISPRNGFEGLVRVEGISYLICPRNWVCGTLMRGSIRIESIGIARDTRDLIYTVNAVPSAAHEKAAATERQT